MSAVQETIRQFILSQYLPGESSSNLRDQTPLQSSGVLDSLAVLNLVSFLQERYGVDFDVYDTTVERFDRIDQIAAAVEKKRKVGSETR